MTGPHDHLVLLGATYHVGRDGADIAAIGQVAREAGATIPEGDIQAVIDRFVDEGLVTRLKPGRFRAATDIVKAFGALHRCYSGIAADAENVRAILEERRNAT